MRLVNNNQMHAAKLFCMFGNRRDASKNNAVMNILAL